MTGYLIDYLMIICDYLTWLFDDCDDYLMIISDNYLMIIWWLFDDYLMIIWWLFDSNYLWLFDDYLRNDYLIDYLRNDYLWLFDDYLMVIIRDYLMIIRFPSQQQVGWSASFPNAFVWNSGTSWWWQPFHWAYRSLRAAESTLHHPQQSCLL